ncbi:ABC transporter ATP-binding protein [Pseudomonas helleri]|uniref:ABC transporter ATP-binding protein n=1 Tax=Pseudomonas helleri TaxID=1608996 RepID=UPI00333FA349
MIGAEAVLNVESLNVSVGLTTIVRDLSFTVKPGKILALVGESGCGKSMTASALMGLLPGGVSMEAQRLSVGSQSLIGLDSNAMRRIRGDRMAMIFQDPMSSLNPVLTIGEQICESILAHSSMSRAEARNETIRLLSSVHIPRAAERFSEYPHRLSGGMRQRVMIAIALANSPKVLIADEPTTALDVSVQSEILGLIDELRREKGMAVVLISHDLGVVSQYADDILVMYAGRGIEYGRSSDVLNRPRHPYTRALIDARPKLGSLARGKRQPLKVIAGVVPAPHAMPRGCPFAPRCAKAQQDCLADVPLLHAVDGQKYACFHPEPDPYANLHVAL